MSAAIPGTLYIVGTPIGNLGDITQRALEVLRAVDVVAAEDTRHSGHLLTRYGIRKPLLSYHEHNEARRTAELVAELDGGRSIALITDAGMPGVSDPGYRLVRACVDRGLPLVVVPGASAVLTALVGSGFACDRFFFGGFLPMKAGQKEREIVAAAARAETSVYFESPHRLLKALALFQQHAAGRQLCVARELTKRFEEFQRGLAGELIAHYTAHPPKGEITLVVSALTREDLRAGKQTSAYS